MATSQQRLYPIASTEVKHADHDNLKEQSLFTMDESVVNSSQDAPVTNGNLNGNTDQSGYTCSIGEGWPKYNDFVNNGHDNSVCKWNNYTSYNNAEGLQIGSSGYGYNPQIPYGTYPSGSTELPSLRGDGLLYTAQQFSTSVPRYYQQSVSPNISYVASPSVTPAECEVNIDQRGHNNLVEPIPGFTPSLGPFGNGNQYLGDSGSSSLTQQGFGLGELWSDWSDWSNLSNGQSSLASPTDSQQSIGSLRLSWDNFGLASQQQSPFSGFGCRSSSCYRGRPHNGVNRGSSYGTKSTSSLGMNDERWIAMDRARRGLNNESPCNCTATFDRQTEQNRGPRGSKPRNETTANGYSNGNSKNGTRSEVHSGSYNRLDFVTEYKNAKFFVIKSYSEDNVHKSIKYGVWTSTQNGNKKLDDVYHKAMEKEGTCPVFLLFSVNASAQFCGVAEMLGPVDFDESVDYWQQDKWTGQFPVRWHIVKDVPNIEFRHIILENNDHKPVTNSRDTQEVKLEQGIEMLNIFKNYRSFSSILDDFDFYENRQKSTQERKARDNVTLLAEPVVGGNVHHQPVSLPNDFVKQMSKTFAQALLLNETKHPQPGKRVSVTTVSKGTGIESRGTKTTLESLQRA